MTTLYKFQAKLWLYEAKAAWHFITVPSKISSEIKFLNEGRKSAWGSIRVLATIGKTQWKTSLFPDSKSGAYLLPVKSDVRKKENVTAENKVSVTLEIIG
jgi:hypothetical protein